MGEIHAGDPFQLIAKEIETNAKPIDVLEGHMRYSIRVLKHDSDNAQVEILVLGRKGHPTQEATMGDIKTVSANGKIRNYNGLSVLHKKSS